MTDLDPPASERVALAEPVLKFRSGWAVVLLSVVVLAAFLPVRDNQFVNLDDQKNFVENPSFRGLGWRQLAWAWTTGHLGVYQPLSWIVLEAQFAAWGLDPRGYHLTSLALQLLVAIALYTLTVDVLARRLAPRPDPGTMRACSCAAVALFAVHPLRVEVVAWVSCQPYLLCAVFSVLAVLVYLRAHEAPPRVNGRRLLGALLLCAAALLSKPVAIPLPAVLLILDVYPLGRLGPGRWFGLEARRVYREKVPFLALGTGFMVLAVWARARGIAPLAGYGIEPRIAQACYGAWFYLFKTLLPYGNSACYPLPARITLREPRFLLSALALLAVTSGLVALRRRWPGVLAAWSVYLLMLAPSSGLVLMSQGIAADRYSYLPLMGLTVLLACGMCRVVRAGRLLLPGRFPNGVFLVGLIAVLSVLIGRTRDQCRTWRTSADLWSHALAVSTEPNPFAAYSLGIVLAREPGTLGEAHTLIDQAVRQDPSDPKAHNALATVLAREGRIDAALAESHESLRLDPESSYARVTLGNILAIRGDRAGALAAYQKALQCDAENPEAHSNLGVFLLIQGKSREAEAHLLEALRIHPGMVQARCALEGLGK